MKALHDLMGLAGKATPGPYVHFSGSRGVYAERELGDVAIATMASGNKYRVERVNPQSNGEYFTALSPKVITALCAVAIGSQRLINASDHIVREETDEAHAEFHAADIELKESLSALKSAVGAE